jgi:hypothetical protein
MKWICFFAVLTLAAVSCDAQGCSDAGFCSLGILKNNLDDTVVKKHNRLDFGLNYGKGEQNTNTLNEYVEYHLAFRNGFSFQSKVTATYASGFLGSAFDIGDWYGTLNYSSNVNALSRVSFIAGIKVPLSKSNGKNSDGKPLPLDYQASIGSYDAIGGVNYVVNRKWEFDGAIQLPVIQVNQNTFFPNENADPRERKFAPTNNFRRKGDVLGRIGYYFYLPKDITLKPSLSGIYHTANDSYEDFSGNRIAIAGSRGITLNGSIVATKKLKNSNQFEVVIGAPFIVRKVRPDGLTRDAVINLQYTIGF